MILLSLLAFGHASYAESLKTIRIGSPDLTAGQKHAGGGVVDVLYNKNGLSKNLQKTMSKWSGTSLKVLGQPLMKH